MASSAATVASQRVARLQKSDWTAWIQRIDAFLLDCDGVLWRGDSAIPGAKEMVAKLRQLQKRVVFVTNNSTTSRDKYVKKLGAQGIPASVEDIVTYGVISRAMIFALPDRPAYVSCGNSSASATAAYLAKQLGGHGKLYVVGEAGLVQELRDRGFTCLGLEDGNVSQLPLPFVVDKDIRAVVAGLDRYLSYYKLAYASTCARDIPGCLFIATNNDQTFPTGDIIAPGGGAVVNFLQTAIGRPPAAIIGKPSQDLLQTVLTTYGLEPSRTCMVGDKLETDIEFGRRGGLETLLVLTGVTERHELNNPLLSSLHTPSFYMESVDDINHVAVEH